MDRIREVVEIALRIAVGGCHEHYNGIKVNRNVEGPANTVRNRVPNGMKQARRQSASCDEANWEMRVHPKIGTLLDPVAVPKKEPRQRQDGKNHGAKG